MNLLCICIVSLLLFGYNTPISYTKVRIKPKNLLKFPQTFDYYAFISRLLLNKSVLLQSRAVDAYECLFSGLRYICNTCTQVVDRYITLILRKEVSKYRFKKTVVGKCLRRFFVGISIKNNILSFFQYTVYYPYGRYQFIG